MFYANDMEKKKGIVLDKEDSYSDSQGEIKIK